jgi:hypothetical protein
MKQWKNIQIANFDAKKWNKTPNRSSSPVITPGIINYSDRPEQEPVDTEACGAMQQ